MLKLGGERKGDSMSELLESVAQFAVSGDVQVRESRSRVQTAALPARADLDPKEHVLGVAESHRSDVLDGTPGLHTRVGRLEQIAPPAERLLGSSVHHGVLPPDNEMWEVGDVARFLKRSVSWVYKKSAAGVLPVRRLDGWGLRYVPEEVRAWVGGQKRTRAW